VRPGRLIKLADAMRLTHWPDGRPRVSVLLYHRIIRPDEYADPTAAVCQHRFDRQLGYLAEAGYTCVPLDSLIDYVRTGETVPARSFTITFDDGFLDTYRLAWPVLQRHAMTATVFLASDLIGKQAEWMRVEPSGPQLLMGADHVRRMHADGIDFASHGCTHPHMTALADGTLAGELARSRARISELLGQEIRTLAYPYGQFDDRVQAVAARAGYDAAASVIAGWNHPGTDPMALRRIVVTDRDSGALLLLKMILGVHVLRPHTVGAHIARGACEAIARRLGM